MNQPEKKTVFIIPSLKEISKDATYIGSTVHSGFKKINPFKGGAKYRDVCGSGFTNENCMADYNEKLGYKVKREDYTEQSKMGKNSNVNSYLLDSGINFEVVQDLNQLIIDEHNDNWKVLFEILDKQTGMYYKQNENLRPKEGKGIIYVAGHQHSFQKKLFKFEKLSNPKKKYGFYNGSVVKVYKDGEGLQVKMAYVPKNKGETKDKYQYIEQNTDMKHVLKKGSMESIQQHKLLDSFDVYFIRHGTALHNIKEVKKNKKIQKYLLNSPLLKLGKKQALEINTKFTDELPGKERIILFSSPLDRAVETGILSAYGKQPEKLHDKFDKMLESTLKNSGAKELVEEFEKKSESTIKNSGANNLMSTTGGRKTKKSNYKSRTKKLKKRQTRKRIKINRRRKTKRSRN